MIGGEWPGVSLFGMARRNGSGIELLADPTRRRIVALLALHPARSSQIASEIGLSRPATSRQLGLLVDAGLVTFKRFVPDRRGVLYALEPNATGPILAWLAGVEIGRPTPPWPHWWRGRPRRGERRI